MSKPSFALLSDPQGREEAWSDHSLLHTERVSHRQEALHLIVAPRHRDSTQGMTTGAFIMFPAEGNSTTVSAIDNHRAGEIQGQRLDSSSRLTNLESEADLYPNRSIGENRPAQRSLYQGGILRQPGGQHLVQVPSTDIDVPHQE